MKKYLKFAWWNTSLSPLGKSRTNGNQAKIADLIVAYLLKELDIDCLALGEISIFDLKRYQNQNSIKKYDIYDGTLKEGRLSFDTGLIYKKQLFRKINSLAIISRRGTQKLKTAHRIDLLHPDSQLPFHIFITHWPSRAWCAKNSCDRDFLGIKLREAIDTVKTFYDKSPKIIILGDFNDEPYDPSLAEHLLASRDRSLVRKKNEFLYNPFWRFLGEFKPHVPGKSIKNSGAGSYYYSKGHETKWRTFDQIIFSSVFLTGNDWELNEEFTKIINLFPYFSVIKNRNEIFDHLPVISVLEQTKEVTENDELFQGI